MPSSQGLNPHFSQSPALAGKFFTTTTTWWNSRCRHNKLYRISHKALCVCLCPSLMSLHSALEAYPLLRVWDLWEIERYENTVAHSHLDQEGAQALESGNVDWQSRGQTITAPTLLHHSCTQESVRNREGKLFTRCGQEQHSRDCLRIVRIFCRTSLRIEQSWLVIKFVHLSLSLELLTSLLSATFPGLDI